MVGSTFTSSRDVVFPPIPATFPRATDCSTTGGDGTFEDATECSGISRMKRGYGHGVAVGDFDNDGRPDLFVTRWRSYSLYRNRGDGAFEDVTNRTGLGGDAIGQLRPPGPIWITMATSIFTSATISSGTPNTRICANPRPGPVSRPTPTTFTSTACPAHSRPGPIISFGMMGAGSLM